MKKLLLTLLTVACAVSAWAQTFADNVIFEVKAGVGDSKADPVVSVGNSSIGGSYSWGASSKNVGTGKCWPLSVGTGWQEGSNYIAISAKSGDKFKGGDVISINAMIEAKSAGRIVAYASNATDATVLIDNGTVDNFPASASSPTTKTLVVPNGEYDTLYLTKVSGGTVYVFRITVTRPTDISLNGSGYATLSSDLDVTISGATAYKASVAGSEITLTSIGTSIPANEGVILYGGSNATVTVTSAPTVAAITGNDLLATSNTILPAEGYTYVLNGNEFKQFTGSALSPNKAYFHFGEQKANVMSLIFDDNESTGIQNVEQNAQNGVAYNLAGQRVAANAKGIVIVNGKKYINK